ncbi:MAG: M20/M25/M40 family metallo-hydrolase [Betaproteobacteria bacterium]
MIPSSIALLLITGLLAGAPAGERAISAAVDAHNAEALALLERAVDVNSGTLNLDGVRDVGRIFRAEFDRLGFKTEWVDGAAWHRAGHLVATHPGPGPKLLLIGHLDTVFEKDSPFQTFRRSGPHMASGPGVIDMKGGDVVIVYALRALADAGALKAMNVTVVMTGDEEDAGTPLTAARAALVEAAKGAAAAIGFEDGPGDPRYAVTARRGDSGWKLTVIGTPAHSSQIFRDDIGPGAVFEAAHILDTFRQKLAGEAHLTFNPGVILGGTAVDYDDVQMRGTASGKTNIVAAHAVVQGDLRTLSKEQLDRTRQTMRAVVGATLPHTQAAISFDEGYPPLAPTEGNARLLAIYDRASRDLGFGPVAAADPDKAGAADVSFVAGEVPMIIDGVGLMGHDDHTPGETADLSTLPSQTKRAALLLYRLSTGGAAHGGQRP